MNTEQSYSANCQYLHAVPQRTVRYSEVGRSDEELTIISLTHALDSVVEKTQGFSRCKHGVQPVTSVWYSTILRLKKLEQMGAASGHRTFEEKNIYGSNEHLS